MGDSAVGMKHLFQVGISAWSFCYIMLLHELIILLNLNWVWSSYRDCEGFTVKTMASYSADGM